MLRDALYAPLEGIEDLRFRALEECTTSVIRYFRRRPLPGFLIVFKDDVPCFLEEVVRLRSWIPAGVTTLCLKRSELFQVSLPAHTTHTDIAEAIFTPWWIRAASRLVTGLDIRSEVAGQADPRACLAVHLEAVLHYARNHLFLLHLTRGSHVPLVKAVARLAENLMETALLLHGDFEPTGTSVKERFASRFCQAPLQRAVEGLAACELASAEPTTQKQAAFDALWHMEQLVRELRTHCS